MKQGFRQNAAPNLLVSYDPLNAISNMISSRSYVSGPEDVNWWYDIIFFFQPPSVELAILERETSKQASAFSFILSLTSNPLQVHI